MLKGRNGNQVALELDVFLRFYYVRILCSAPVPVLLDLVLVFSFSSFPSFFFSYFLSGENKLDVIVQLFDGERFVRDTVEQVDDGLVHLQSERRK